MAIQNAYLQGVYEGLAKRNPEQKEFLQAVEEVLESSSLLWLLTPSMRRPADRAPCRARAHHHVPCALGGRCR